MICEIVTKPPEIKLAEDEALFLLSSCEILYITAALRQERQLSAYLSCIVRVIIIK